MTYAHRQPCTCSACGQHDPVIQPELDLQADFVGDIDDDAGWSLAPATPARISFEAAAPTPAERLRVQFNRDGDMVRAFFAHAEREPLASRICTAIGSAIAGALLGMVRS